MVVDIIIPALNEADAVGRVVSEIEDPRVRRVVVVDNGSQDNTPTAARAAGATVLHEPQRGYGRACLTGLAYLRHDPPDVVAFMDGDRADYPAELKDLLSRIEDGADMVIGSRVARAEPKALTPQARFGNWLSTRLILHLYGVSFTDLGPFRAIRWDALDKLGMMDEDFGWTVEMQVKAAKLAMRSDEIDVGYRPRIGTSKVSGTVVGSVRAGHKILWTLFRERLT